MIPYIPLRAIETVVSPSKTFRQTEKKVSGTLDELEAVTQSVRHILNTERYAYPIYGDDYGIEFEQYKGITFAYLQATIQANLDRALLQDDRIKSIEIMALEQSENSAILMLRVHTVFGEINLSKTLLSVRG